MFRSDYDAQNGATQLLRWNIIARENSQVVIMPTNYWYTILVSAAVTVVVFLHNFGYPFDREPGSSTTTQPVIIHVNPAGDDAQEGTPDRPVATPIRALELALASRLMLGPQGDITILFADGRYYLPSPLFITAQHAPGPGKLRFRAANPGQAILSGGRPIMGWQTAGEYWQADVTPVDGEPWFFRELFVNGQRAVRARTPNEGFFRIDRPGLDRRTSLFIRREHAEAFPQNIVGIEFIYLHDWSTSRVIVESFNRDTLEVRFSQKIGCSAKHYEIGNWPNARYFLENSPAFMDRSGEWYLDSEAHRVLYRPREGESLENMHAVAPVLDRLVVMSGDPQTGARIRAVEWEGIVFEHCRFDLPTAGYAAGQATIYEPRRDPNSPTREMIPAAITLDLCEDCSFTRCEFRHLGGSGVWFRRECRQCLVKESQFWDISGNGINIGETLTRPIGEAAPHWISPYQNGCTWGIRVEDCVVRECGVQFLEGVGIWIGLSPGNTITHNEIAHLPYTGISVGWSWNDQPTGCGDNLISHNHIHHCMLILHDGGGIYTLGRQPETKLIQNVIHDIPPNEDGAESNGIFMDEGSSDILVQGQTIFRIGRSPLRFHRALEITLRENHLICLPGVPPYRYNRTDPQTLRFENDKVEESAEWQAPEGLLQTVGPRVAF